jgi:hypothetical protein
MFTDLNVAQNVPGFATGWVSIFQLYHDTEKSIHLAGKLPRTAVSHSPSLTTGNLGESG